MNNINVRADSSLEKGFLATDPSGPPGSDMWCQTTLVEMEDGSLKVVLLKVGENQFTTGQRSAQCEVFGPNRILKLKRKRMDARVEKCYYKRYQPKQIDLKAIDKKLRAISAISRKKRKTAKSASVNEGRYRCYDDGLWEQDPLYHESAKGVQTAREADLRAPRQYAQDFEGRKTLFLTELDSREVPVSTPKKLKPLKINFATGKITGAVESNIDSQDWKAVERVFRE